MTQALAGSGQTYVLANPSAKLDIFHNGVPCKPPARGCDPDTGFNSDAGDLGADGASDGFPNASRIYKSMELILTKRFSANWQFFGSYRLSKLYGNFEGSFRNDNGQQDPNISSLFDFTNSDNVLGDQFTPGVLPPDRRHALKMFTNYRSEERRVGKECRL